MMFRLAFFAMALSCWLSVDLLAADPASWTIVVANHTVASSLPPLPTGASLAVLIEHDNESYDVINDRALTLRNATHFVYLHGQETQLSALYRERITAQGAIAIALPVPPLRQKLSQRLLPLPSFESLLATVSTRP